MGLVRLLRPMAPEAFAEHVCGQQGLAPQMRICETGTVASD